MCDLIFAVFLDISLFWLWSQQEAATCATEYLEHFAGKWVN